MALYLDLAPGNAVRVGDTTITVEAKSGARTRLRIEGPDRVQQQRRMSAWMTTHQRTHAPWHRPSSG